MKGFICHVILLLVLKTSFINAQVSGDSIKNNKNVKFTAYPAAGYSPETSLSLGIVGFIVFNPNEKQSRTFHRPSSISPYFLYTLKKQFLSAIDVEFYPGDQWNFNTTIRFFNYPDYFYGIGNNSDENRELYTNKFFKWNGDVFWSKNNKRFIGLNYHFQFNQIDDLDPNGRLLTENIYGIEGGNIIGIGPVFKFDNRDNIFYPSKGFFLELKTLFYPDAFGNDYVFNEFKIDFRSFLTVFSKQNILGFQVYYNHTNGKNIPFYMLPQLGGDSRLRGIEHENRYRDHHSYYLQVEGRRHLFWRLGGVIFAGMGDVSPNLQAISFSSLKYVVGIGGRFQPFKNEKLNVRLDIGKGPGAQYGIYLAVREAF